MKNSLSPWFLRNIWMVLTYFVENALLNSTLLKSNKNNQTTYSKIHFVSFFFTLTLSIYSLLFSCSVIWGQQWWREHCQWHFRWWPKRRELAADTSQNPELLDCQWYPATKNMTFIEIIYFEKRVIQSWD